jgi:N-carbamoylputrescine amidase
VLACNRVGREGAGGAAERWHAGRSLLVDPLGMIRAEASGTQPQLLAAQIDLDEVQRARTGLAWWRDRRPDLYGPLAR